MAITYFGVKLSENWIERADGSLIFRNAVIARTGFQKYKGKELEPKELEAAGVVVEPEDEIELFRSEDEVFSAATIGSFESVPVTDGHPEKLLSPQTIAEHQCGHIQNVRRGSEPLESGDLPLLADVIVTSPYLIEKIKSGLRQLSCGYNYHILKVNGVLNQVDMIGNHVAFVPVGRAGPEASIQDALPNWFNWKEFQMATTANKFRKLIATALHTLAKNGTQEEFSVALDAAIDAEPEAKPKADDAHPEGCRCADCKGTGDAAPKVAATDAKAKDRKKYHDALDRMMDSKDSEQESMDADMEELKSMFKENSGATDAEPDEPEGEDESPIDIEETEATDEGEALVVEPVDRPKSLGTGTDAGYKAGAAAVLKALRPVVAKSTDTKLRGAFDTAAKLVNGTPTTTNKGSYAGAARAAGRVAADAGVDPAVADIEAANKAYAELKKSMR